MAITTLPYPNMDFVPLDVLTADELDQIVANIDAINNASIPTDSIADGAVTSSKIDWTTFDYSGAESTPVTVGTSYVTLVTLPIASGGLYFLIANVTRETNSPSGALIYLNFQKNSNDLRTFMAPTVPNYAGNHEPTNVGFVVFSASVGDSVTIRVRKDRNDYSSTLGTQYSLVKIA